MGLMMYALTSKPPQPFYGIHIIVQENEDSFNCMIISLQGLNTYMYEKKLIFFLFFLFFFAKQLKSLYLVGFSVVNADIFLISSKFLEKYLLFFIFEK